MVHGTGTEWFRMAQGDSTAHDAAGSTRPTADTQARPIVDTAYGRLAGERIGSVDRYRGIPYAASPVGKRRFLSPAPPAPWSGTRMATSLGHPCPQDNPDYPNWLDPVPESEDCLFLNVWTPARARSSELPVMVWLHGGGCRYGSAGAPGYDGAVLADRADAVVVSVNHRLNVFGYLWLGDVVPGLAAHAMPGQRDIVAALAWIRDNIAGLGGDAGNVTLFGQSGGGLKISALLATPEAKGLFHKAIIQSGSQLSVMNRDDANKITAAVLEKLGATRMDLDRLQEFSVQQLKEAARAVVDEVGGLAFQPVVDGSLLPRQTWAQGAPPESRDIPLMIGTTSHDGLAALEDGTPIESDEELKRQFLASEWIAPLPEGTFERLVRHHRKISPGMTRRELLVAMITDLGMLAPAVRQAEKKLADRGAPVYFYEFAWRTPCYDSSWAIHSVELPFVFGNLVQGTAWDGLDDDALRSAHDPANERYRLAEETIAAWAAFAHRGNPSTPSLYWPEYVLQTRSTMVFDRGGSTVENDRNAARRMLTDGLPTWI